MRTTITSIALLAALTALAWGGEDLTSAGFTKEAAMAGKAEVDLGQLALQKADDQIVKTFAKMMVDDHTKANKELGAIASQGGFPLPADVGPEQAAAAAKLKQLSGDEFARAYAAQMVADHKKAVALFRSAAEDDGVDAVLRKFARETLPKLEHHLKESEALNAKLGNTADAR